jgi:two-component system cell cycle sensor histidine kinase/response regulator CckA
VRWGGHTALVVDDDAGIRRLISGLLRSCGFRVLEAQNGLEAVQVYGSYHSRIALVVTDIEMPVMDGFEAVARMRALDRDIPILVVSGRIPDGFQPAPRCSWLSKPFTPAQLLTSVELALGGPGGGGS